MDAAFTHFEILGPRAGLDGWLSVLQDLGTCHLADAMHGLEGEPEIGRPAPSFEEMQAEMVRSEAGRALRAVERVLPPSRLARSTTPSADRPDWQLDDGAGGAGRLAGLRDESLALAGQLRERLEAVRVAEDEGARFDALVAASRALRASGRVGTGDGATGSTGAVRMLALPRATRRIRRLARRMRRAGLTVLRAEGRVTRVLVVCGVDEDAAVLPIAEVVGARVLAFPDELLAQATEAGTSAGGLEAACRREQERALAAERVARAALLARVAEVGPRARLLLDALEDADARMAARKQMAGTRHIAAARVYVRRENVSELRERLARAAGQTVVVRPLAEAGDQPTVPRQVAPAPLAALEGLLPRTFGDVSMASLLALFAPIAVAAVWADVAGGIILLLAGGLMGAAARPGSPRRDAALLGQVAGLLCLLLGVLSGHAFGAVGEAWFGTNWGLAPGAGSIAASMGGSGDQRLSPFLGMLHVLGQVAGGIALWGLLLTLRSWRGERVARARSRLISSCSFAAVSGLALASLPPAHALHAFWPVAPAAFLGVFLLGGPRALFFGLTLELVGVMRLVVVGGGALLLFHAGFEALVEPGIATLLVVPPVLLVGAVAVLADPAHLAMGVPYDLSLGGRQVSRPFAPLRRRARFAPG